MISYRSADILKRVKEQQDLAEREHEYLYDAKMLFDKWRFYFRAQKMSWDAFFVYHSPTVLLKKVKNNNSPFMDFLNQELPSTIPQVIQNAKDPLFKKIFFEEAKRLGWGSSIKRADILDR